MKMSIEQSAIVAPGGVNIVVDGKLLSVTRHECGGYAIVHKPTGFAVCSTHRYRVQSKAKVGALMRELERRFDWMFWTPDHPKVRQQGPEILRLIGERLGEYGIKGLVISGEDKTKWNQMTRLKE
jgi:hypothetical protein